MRSYIDELQARVEHQLSLPLEERMLFVIAEQVGGSGTPSHILLHGPWQAQDLDFDCGPNDIRNPEGEIDREMVAGFFEIESDAIGIDRPDHRQFYRQFE